jgi:hypothetical protein
MTKVERDMAKKKSDEPEHPFRLRMPESLFRRLEALAARHQRSTNGEVVFALRQYADEEEAKDREGGEQ